MQGSIWKNIYWKEFGLLAFVWVAFLGLQVAKVRTRRVTVSKYLKKSWLSYHLHTKITWPKKSNINGFY
jgi:hypothetical protein